MSGYISAKDEYFKRHPRIDPPRRHRRLRKTGTVTTGRMTLLDVITSDGVDADEVLLRLAGALEDASEHPIATGVIERIGDLPAVAGFQNTEGLGVPGYV